LSLMNSDSFSVSVAVSPEYTWSLLAVIENWPEFSPFAQSVSRVDANSWQIGSPQGDILLRSHFVREHLLLDHEVHTGGQWVFIPYRVVPNLDGCELIMTNFQSPGDSDDEYREQNDWVIRELHGAKQFLESRRPSIEN
jgi:hypothetical protein